MATLLVKKNQIENIVLPSIGKSKNLCKSARVAISVAITPDGCGTNARSIYSDIDDIVRQLDKVEDKISDSVKKIIRIENSGCDKALDISKETIPLRKNKL